MIEKELKWVHLKAGLDAFNEDDQIKLLAIYLSTALEVTEFKGNPDRLKARYEQVSELTEDEAQEILNFLRPKLDSFSKRWGLPFGPSEKLAMDLMQQVAGLGKLGTN